MIVSQPKEVLTGPHGCTMPPNERHHGTAFDILCIKAEEGALCLVRFDTFASLRVVLLPFLQLFKKSTDRGSLIITIASIVRMLNGIGHFLLKRNRSVLVGIFHVIRFRTGRRSTGSIRFLRSAATHPSGRRSTGRLPTLSSHFFHRVLILSLAYLAITISINFAENLIGVHGSCLTARSL